MYKITSENDHTELLLYSLIEGGTTAGNIIKQLRGTEGSSITLRINSDGGEAFDAIAMYNYLKPKDVSVVVDGICASAASVVAMAGREILMMPGSMMMIHNPCSLVFGDSDRHQAEGEVLDKLREQIAGIYSERTGRDIEDVKAMMDAVTWMTAEEAVSLNFADGIGVTDKAPDLPAAPITDRYDEGVMAERQRLQALDELYAPGREVILNAAKYITCTTASEAALDILKAEQARVRTANLNSLPVKEPDHIQHVSEIIGRLRGR